MHGTLALVKGSLLNIFNTEKATCKTHLLLVLHIRSKSKTKPNLFWSLKNMSSKCYGK